MASIASRSQELKAARRVDSLCRQFEKEWRNGDRPRLEEFLKKMAPPENVALFAELLHLEIELRQASADACDDLCRRFPGEEARIVAVCRDTREKLGLPSNANSPPEDLLECVGRYRLDRLLGEGAFGRVYRATDNVLHRAVALKLSGKLELGRSSAYDVFLAEARVLAQLDHAAIVPVYDAGRLSDGRIYIVTKLIEGTNLAEQLRRSRISITHAADWIARAADAVHFAHQQGLVHRDLKPSNLLVDGDNKIYVSDFGLALRDADYGIGPNIVGTPAYMSPEQARGEGHRVDPRSDVFSLGVILYELLTGRRPFRGETKQEILNQILSSEAHSLRQLDRSIPRELERVCLRALSKRAADRFATAAELANEIRLAGGTPHAPAATAFETAQNAKSSHNLLALAESPRRFQSHVVPKGLRSFDGEDAEFYLSLLPGPRDRAGPRDREGLPRSIQFWRRRVESRQPDTFNVGLLYGPSGCGKSSLVKAGLLPRLAGNVIPVTVEASTDDTETRLLRALRQRFPLLARHDTLAEAFSALRCGNLLAADQKVFVVLDQFEQWLHGRTDYRGSDLTLALRQCEGVHVQCLLLIRDDFWLAVNRFMQELEIPIVENHNAALVDLFDRRHARNVLAAFGQGVGALADNPADWTREQVLFLERAVAGLAHNDKIVCVRLAMFAEMVKYKRWSHELLRHAGGLDGIGEAFLDEVFESRSSLPERRVDASAARALLRALLPEQGVEIKGHRRTDDELRQACGYAERPEEFQSLIDLLDSKLHLITPVDSGEEESSAETNARCFQLTHDYLVPALRSWLTRKQRESVRGRAELCLAERSAWWSARPRKRHLPTAWEWLVIRLWTRQWRWTDPERRMMRAASRYYLRRIALASIFVAILSLAVIGGVSWQRAGDLADRLASADTRSVPALVEQVDRHRFWIEPRLRATLADANSGLRQQLHASLALLPSDARQLEFVCRQMLDADTENFIVLRDILTPYGSKLIDVLWKAVNTPSESDIVRFNAACALADFSPEDRLTDDRWLRIAPLLATQLVSRAVRSPGDFSLLVDMIRPACRAVVEPLLESFLDRKRTAPERLMVTSLLLELAQEQPQVLATMLMGADAEQFESVFVAVNDHRAEIVQPLREVLQSIESPVPFLSEESETNKDLHADRQANAAIALLRLGRSEEVWPLLRQSADPRLRSFIVDRLARYGVTATQIVAELEADQDVSVRRALLLALGEFKPDALPKTERIQLEELAARFYGEDADAGIHGAAEWLLRRWNSELPTQLAAGPRQEDRPAVQPTWYVNGQGHTMVVVPGPAEFTMDVFTSKTDQNRHRTKAHVARTFAISSKEVTVAQFQRFLQEPETVDGELAHGGASWYDAARYCNWLSETEQIPQEQWCYVPAGADGGGVMEAADDALTRTGYRLPTEVEWDYACRSGTVTPRFYGNSTELLAKFAWYYANADEQRHPPGLLKPNDWGLFDVYGNLWEWCHDATEHRPNAESAMPSREDDERIVRGAPYTARPWFLYSSWQSAAFAISQAELVGFRIARTMPSISHGDGLSSAKSTLRTVRSGIYVHNAWHQQTGVRAFRHCNDRDGGTGFRVARTQLE